VKIPFKVKASEHVNVIRTTTADVLHSVPGYSGSKDTTTLLMGSVPPVLNHTQPDPSPVVDTQDLHLNNKPTTTSTKLLATL
jgi:hypothetical protein